jgi:hypothetical protein
VRRRPGDHVLLRQLFASRIFRANTALVVEDSPELVALWLPYRSPTMRDAGDGVFDTRALVPDSLRRHGILRLTAPGRAHSLLRFTDERGTIEGWYVNLEHPLERTALGWDYEDLLLDIWIPADGDPRWLDEDELEEAVARGLVSERDAELARAEGERVLAEWRRPSEWEGWRPDPAWSMPQMPKSWDALT